MEVTRKNFKEKLPIVAEAIQEASFLTLDGEFTGLNNGKSLHGYDTPADRYDKLREGAMDFLLVQFGLCTFNYNEEKERYETKAFNFYVFPRPCSRQAPDERFLCQSSSMDFLASIGFDFNKLFREGIPWLLPVDENRMREQLVQRHQQQSQILTTPDAADGEELSYTKSPVTVPEEHKAFIEDVCSKVGEFLKKEDRSLELEPCNAFLRKLIYQNVKLRYPSGIHIDTKKSEKYERYIEITKADVETRLAMEAAKKNGELEELDDAAGFSKVIKLISQSGKLVVGHNMFLDICHIIHQFSCKLPADYEEFKALARCIFPRLLDTKLMASMQPFKDKINSTTLGELLLLLARKPFKKPVVVPVEHFPGYSTTSEQLHEAGYDAYITGLCFITMANHLGTLQPKYGDKILPGSPLLEPFLNKLFLMRVQDIPYINLAGEELQPARSHVFHVKFPKHWKTTDLIQLFQPFGNVYVAWIDDASALVALHRRDQATVVMRTLTQSDTYHVQTYADYYARQHKYPRRDPLLSWSAGEDGDHKGIPWNKKRSLPESDASRKTKRRRKSGSADSRQSNSTPEGEKEEADQMQDGSSTTAEDGENGAATSSKSEVKPQKIFDESNVWDS